MAKLCKIGPVDIDELLSRMIAGVLCFLPAVLVVSCVVPLKAMLTMYIAFAHLDVLSATLQQLPSVDCCYLIAYA